MTKSPLYEITGMTPLPPRAQTSDSEYESRFKVYSAIRRACTQRVLYYSLCTGK